MQSIIQMAPVSFPTPLLCLNAFSFPVPYCSFLFSLPSSLPTLCLTLSPLSLSLLSVTLPSRLPFPSGFVRTIRYPLPNVLSSLSGRRSGSHAG